MKRLLFAGIVTMCVVTGCSTISLETPDGYNVKRWGLLTKYNASDLCIVTSNFTARAGNVSLSVDTNGLDRAGEYTGKVIGTAIKYAK